MMKKNMMKKRRQTFTPHPYISTTIGDLLKYRGKTYVISDNRGETLHLLPTGASWTKDEKPVDLPMTVPGTGYINLPELQNAPGGKWSRKLEGKWFGDAKVVTRRKYKQIIQRGARY